jgi:hypothetical protein
MSGNRMSSTAASTISVSLMLVANISASPPTSMSRLRRATDTDEPITVWISVVSAVSRERTSPVRVISKNAGVKDRT